MRIQILIGIGLLAVTSILFSPGVVAQETPYFVTYFHHLEEPGNLEIEFNPVFGTQRSSPDKHQVIWRVEGLDWQEAESMLRAMAERFGGDPAATDSTRVLRLSGFANRKYDEEFVVQAHHESNEIYHARDFTVQEDSPETARHLRSESGRRLAQGHKGQSEQDCAYAKRALARGDDQEEIIRRIADFRSEDKADPEYYARHTVAKAQMTLQARKGAPSQEVTEVSDNAREMR